MRAVAGGGDDVGRSWQGPGADAFTRYTADFAHAGAATGDAARGAQRELAGLGRTLQSVRDEIAGHVSDALDAAHARVGPSGTPDPEDVRAAVAEPTARAQAALDRAESEIATSVRRLRALTGEMTGWSRLRSPDAGVSGGAGASSRWAEQQGSTSRGAGPGGPDHRRRRRRVGERRGQLAPERLAPERLAPERWLRRRRLAPERLAPSSGGSHGGSRAARATARATAGPTAAVRRTAVRAPGRPAGTRRRDPVVVLPGRSGTGSAGPPRSSPSTACPPTR